MLLAAAIERLYDLNVGTTPVQEGAPQEKPHKPLLLMAAFDLIDEGLATPDHIPWCQAIRDRFAARFNLVRKHKDQSNPDLPFRYLADAGFWAPLEVDGVTPVRREIRVSDIGKVFARLTGGFEFLCTSPKIAGRCAKLWSASSPPPLAGPFRTSPPSISPPSRDRSIRQW